jgi:hypothetical protein
VIGVQPFREGFQKRLRYFQAFPERTPAWIAIELLMPAHPEFRGFYGWNLDQFDKKGIAQNRLRQFLVIFRA